MLRHSGVRELSVEEYNDLPQSAKDALNNKTVNNPLVWMVNIKGLEDVDYANKYQALLNNVRKAEFGTVQGSVIITAFDQKKIPNTAEITDVMGQLIPRELARLNSQSEPEQAPVETPLTAQQKLLAPLATVQAPAPVVDLEVDIARYKALAVADYKNTMSQLDAYYAKKVEELRQKNVLNQYPSDKTNEELVKRLISNGEVYNNVQRDLMDKDALILVAYDAQGRMHVKQVWDYIRDFNNKVYHEDLRTVLRRNPLNSYGPVDLSRVREFIPISPMEVAKNDRLGINYTVTLETKDGEILGILFGGQKAQEQGMEELKAQFAQRGIAEAAYNVTDVKFISQGEEAIKKQYELASEEFPDLATPKEGKTGLPVIIGAEYKIGAIEKEEFLKAAPNGDKILDELIKDGILEIVSPTEVRIKIGADLKEDIVREITKGDFDKIWPVLQKAKIKEGYVTGVKRWLTLDDMRLEHLDDFGPREAMTMSRSDGTFREVRYYPFDVNTNLLRFSFRTDDEIKSYDLSGKTYSSAEEKEKAKAKAWRNFGFIDEEKERMRGEIFLGPTFTQSEIAKTKFFQFIEKRQEITEPRELKYLKGQFALDLLNMPVTALLELPIPVNTATDFLYNLIFRPDLKNLKGAPKPQEIGKEFGPYILQQDLPLTGEKLTQALKGLPQVDQDYIKNAKKDIDDNNVKQVWNGLSPQGQEIFRQEGMEYIKNLTSAQVEQPLLNFLDRRKTEGTVMFVINELGALAQLAGGADATIDGHLVNKGQYYWSHANHTGLSLVQWNQANSPLLVAVLQQNFVGFNGEGNLAQIFSLIATGKGLPYSELFSKSLQLHTNLNGVQQKVTTSATSILGRIFSSFTPVVDLRSVVNAIATHNNKEPLKAKFLTAPNVVRFKLYTLGNDVIGKWKNISNTKELIHIFEDSQEPAYVIKQNHLWDDVIPLQKEEADGLFSTVGAAGTVLYGKIQLGQENAAGRKMEVPVYLVEDPKTHKQSMVVYTAKGMERILHKLNEQQKREESIGEMNKQGGAIINMGSQGGTLVQDLWTGLFLSHDRQGWAWSSDAYTFDQFMAGMRFIAANNPQVVDKLLRFYQPVVSGQIKVYGKFRGFAKSYNAFTGEVMDNRPDIASTDVIGMLIMQYEHQTHDTKYHQMLGPIADAVVDLKNEKVTFKYSDEVNFKYSEPAAITYKFLQLSGKTKEAKEVLQQFMPVQKEGLFLNGVNEPGHSADATLRWMEVLTPQEYMTIFQISPVRYVDILLNEIPANHAVHPMPQSRPDLILLDNADEIYAGERQSGGKTQIDPLTGKAIRVGNPEATSEYVSVLIIASQYLRQSGRSDLADKLDAQAKFFRNELNKVVNPIDHSLPQAVHESLKDQRIDSGFDFDFTLGERAVAAIAQFDLIGMDPYMLDHKLPVQPLSHIVPPPVLKEDDLLGGKPDVGTDKYYAWLQLISDLVERDALIQKQKSVPLKPEELSRLESLKNSRHEKLEWSDTLTAQDASIVDAQGNKRFVHLVAPPKVTREYNLIRQRQFNDSLLRLKAQMGIEENWRSGGVAFYHVVKDRSGQDAIGELIGKPNEDHKDFEDGMFDSNMVIRVFQEILRLPPSERVRIQKKGYSDFQLNFDVYNNGHKENVWVSLTLPIKLKYLKFYLPDAVDSKATRPNDVIFYDVKQGVEKYRLILNETHDLVVKNYDTKNGALLESDTYHLPAALNINEDTDTLIKEIEAFVDLSPRVFERTLTHTYYFMDPYNPKDYEPNKTITTVFNFDQKGNINLQGYGFSDEPQYAIDSNYITQNEFDRLGRVVVSKDFVNPVSKTDDNWINQLLANPKLAEGQRAVRAREMILPGNMGNHYRSIVSNTDANGTIHLNVLNNREKGRTELDQTTDQFDTWGPANQHVVQTLRAFQKYDPDYFGGQVPYFVLIYNQNQLAETAATKGYDPISGEMKVKITDAHTGNVYERVMNSRKDEIIKDLFKDYNDRKWDVPYTYIDDFHSIVDTKTFINQGIAINDEAKFAPKTGEWVKTIHNLINPRDLKSITTTVLHLSRFNNLIYRDTISTDGITRRYVPVYDARGWEISGIGYRLNPTTGEWDHEFDYKNYTWKNGELTRTVINLLDGNKEWTETLSAQGLVRRHIGEQENVIDENEKIIGTGHLIDENTYNDTRYPLLARSTTRANIRFNDGTPRIIPNIGSSSPLNVQNGILTIRLIDNIRHIISQEEQDINLRNRLNSSSVFRLFNGKIVPSRTIYNSYTSDYTPTDTPSAYKIYVFDEAGQKRDATPEEIGTITNNNGIRITEGTNQRSLIHHTDVQDAYGHRLSTKVDIRDEDRGIPVGQVLGQSITTNEREMIDLFNTPHRAKTVIHSVSDGKIRNFTESHNITPLDEFLRTGLVRSANHSFIWDNRWEAVNNGLGQEIKNIEHVYAQDVQGRSFLLGDRIIENLDFNNYYEPQGGRTTIRVYGINNSNNFRDYLFNHTTSVNSPEEHKNGIVRYTTTNDINGLIDEVAKDGYNRVFEDIQIGENGQRQRYLESREFDEFGFAHYSETRTDSRNGPLYTWSTLQNSIDDIIKTNRARARIHIHNVFLPNEWEVYKDYRGRVAETDKGDMVNGQLQPNIKTVTYYEGIPGLIDLANRSETYGLDNNGKEIGDAFDKSTLRYGNGDKIKDIYSPDVDINKLFIHNRTVSDRHVGFDYNDEAIKIDTRETRDNRGHLLETRFGYFEGEEFIPTEIVYTFYEMAPGELGLFDIGSKTITAAVINGREEIFSYANNTNVKDGYLYFLVKRGFVDQQLNDKLNTVTKDGRYDFLNDTLFSDLYKGHLRFQFTEQAWQEVKDADGQLIARIEGYTKLDPETQWGKGNPRSIAIVDYNRGTAVSSQGIDLPTQLKIGGGSYSYGMKFSASNEPILDINEYSSLRRRDDGTQERVFNENWGTHSFGLEMRKGPHDQAIMKYKVIDRRKRQGELALSGTALRADGRLYYNDYKGYGFEPQKQRLYYDELIQPNRTMILENELGIKARTEKPKNVIMALPRTMIGQDGQKHYIQGVMDIYEFDASPKTFSLMDQFREFKEKNPEWIFDFKGIPSRTYFNGRLISIQWDKYRSETKDYQGLPYYDAETDTIKFGPSPEAYDRGNNDLIGQTINRLRALYGTISNHHSQDINSGYVRGSQGFDKAKLETVNNLRKELIKQYTESQESKGKASNALSIIIGILVGVISLFAFKLLKRIFGKAQQQSHKEQVISKANDLNKGINAFIKDVELAQTSEDLDKVINKNYPENVKNLALGLKRVMAIGRNYFGETQVKVLLVKTIKDMADRIGKDLPADIKMDAIGHLIFEEMVIAVHMPIFEAYFEKYGLTNARLTADGKAWKFGNVEIKTTDQGISSLRGRTNIPLKEYIIHHRIMSKLITRLADPDEASERVWGYHDNRDMTGSPFDPRFWIKVERARADSNVEQLVLSNLMGRLEREANPDEKEKIQKEIDELNARGVKPYKGWFEISYEEFFLRELFMFLTGNLQGQVAWTRHLLKLAEEKLRMDKLEELIPEIVNRSANILYILGVQFDQISNKIRKGNSDNWIWRIYFEEFFLTRLLQTRDYDEPLKAYGLTLSDLNRITENFKSFKEGIRNQYNSLVSTLGPDAFPGYIFIRSILQESRGNDQLHNEIVQRIVDEKFIPIIRKSLIEGDYSFFSKPTVYINLRRTIDLVAHFFSYSLLTIGFAGAVAALIALLFNQLLPLGISFVSVIPPVVITGFLLFWKTKMASKDKILKKLLSVEDYKLVQFKKQLRPVGYFDGVLDQIINTQKFQASEETKKTWPDALRKQDEFGRLHYLKYGRIIPNVREFTAVVAAGFFLFYGLNAVFGLPLWFTALAALGSLFIYQMIVGTSRYSLSWPALVNVIVPLFSWIFSMPILSQVSGLTYGHIDLIKFFILIALPAHFVLGLSFMFLVRGGMYMGQMVVNKRAIKKKYRFYVRYNFEIVHAIKALKAILYDKPVSVFNYRIGAVIFGLLTVSSSIVIAASTFLNIGIIIASAKLTILTAGAFIVPLVFAYGLWRLTRIIELYKNIHLNNYKVKEYGQDMNIVRARALELWRHRIYALAKAGNNTIDIYTRKKLLNFEPVIPKGHEDKFANSIRRILGSFYNLDTPELFRQWTERPATTLYHSAYIEDFGLDYSKTDMPGVAGLTDWTASKKDEKGQEVWDRKVKAYPTEMNNLVVNVFFDEWRKFAQTFDIMTSNSSKLTDNQIQEIRNRVLSTRFETPQEGLKLREDLKKILGDEAGEWVVTQMVHWANMRIPMVYRTLEGFKEEVYGFRNVAEYSFFSECYQILKETYGPLAKDLQKRLVLARNVVNALKGTLLERTLKEKLSNGDEIFAWLMKKNYFGTGKDFLLLDNDKTTLIKNTYPAVESEKILAILSEYAKRIKELEGVIMRTGWLPLILLTPQEVDIVLNSGLKPDQLEFLRYDLFYDQLVKDKFIIHTVFITDLKDVKGLQSSNYIDQRPENRFLFSRLANRGAPSTKFLMGTAGIPEMTGAFKATVIANASRYRYDVSMRQDAIMEVKPEEGIWIVNNVDELSKPNIMGLIFPMYVADRYLSDVAAAKNFNESNWTMMVQSFMNETGQVGEYGKYMHKEEYEQIYGISPLSRNAEDLSLTLLGLGLGIGVVYNHGMFVGGAKVADYKGDLGTESKYAADNYEMIHDLLGQLLNKSTRAPISWKWTHLFNTGAFWGLKPLVVLNVITFTIFQIVLFIDPAHSFPFAAAFVASGIVLALSIVQNLITLLNAQYGAPWGFLKFINAFLFKPAAAMFSTSEHPLYAWSVARDTIEGKDVFIPAGRKTAADIRTDRDIYQTFTLGPKIGTVLLPLILLFAPYHPAVFLMSAFLYFLLIFAYIIGPNLFNSRPVFINHHTNWLGNGLVASALGILIITKFSIVSPVILSAIVGVQIILMGIGAWNHYKGTKMHIFFSQKSWEQYTTAAMFILLLLGDLTMVLPLAVKYLTDDNYRTLAWDISRGLVKSMFWSTQDMAKGLLIRFGRLNIAFGAGLIAVLGGVYINSLTLFLFGLLAITVPLIIIKIIDSGLIGRNAMIKKFYDHLNKPDNGKNKTWLEDQLADKFDAKGYFDKKALRKVLQLLTHWPVMRFINGGFFGWDALTKTDSLLARELGLSNESVLEHIMKAHPEDLRRIIMKLSRQTNVFRPVKDLGLSEEEIEFLINSNPGTVIKTLNDLINLNKMANQLITDYQKKGAITPVQQKGLVDILIHLGPLNIQNVDSLLNGVKEEESQAIKEALIKAQAATVNIFRGEMIDRMDLESQVNRYVKLIDELTAWANSFIWIQAPDVDANVVQVSRELIDPNTGHFITLDADMLHLPKPAISQTQGRLTAATVPMPIKVTPTHEAKVAMKVSTVAGKAGVEVIEGQIALEKVDQLRSTIEAAAIKVGLSNAEFTLNLADTKNGFIAETDINNSEVTLSPHLGRAPPTVVEAVLLDEFQHFVTPGAFNDEVAAITANIIAQNGYMLAAFKNWINANFASGVITYVHPAFKKFVTSLIGPTEDKLGALIHGLEWPDLVENLKIAKAAFAGGQILKIRYAFSRRSWKPENERDFGEFLAKFFGVDPSRVSIVESYVGGRDKRVEFNIVDGNISLLNDVQGDVFETMSADSELLAQAEKQRAEDEHNILVWDGKIGFSSSQKLVINGLDTCAAVSVWGTKAQTKPMPLKVTATHEAKVAMKVTIVAGKARVEVIEGQIASEKVEQLRSTIEAAAAKVGLSNPEFILNAEFTLNLADTKNGFIAETDTNSKEVTLSPHLGRAPPEVVEVVLFDEFKSLANPNMDNDAVAAITAGIIEQNGYMLAAFTNWINANIASGVITYVHPAFKKFVTSPIGTTNSIIPLDGTLTVSATQDVQGMAVTALRFLAEGRAVEGRAVVIAPENAGVEVFVDQDAVNYDFSKNAQTPELAKKLNREFKEFPGRTVREFTAGTPAVFAVNGHQGNYWLPNTLVIKNGQLVAKPVAGVRQNVYETLNGIYTFFVLNGSGIGLVDIEIRNSHPVRDISSIQTALSGPVLLRNGTDVSSAITQKMPPFGSNEVTWDPTKDTMAFSLVGKDKSGRLVFITMRGDSEKQPEALLSDIVTIAKNFELTDAVLLGTSADVQQHVTGQEIIVAKPRFGSDKAAVRPEGRKLGSIIFVSEKKAATQYRTAVLGSKLSIAQWLKEEILRNGPMTLRKYYYLAMFAPETDEHEGGFYQEKARQMINGARPDTVSGSISAIAPMIVNNIYAAWNEQGKPAKFHWLETASATGEMMNMVLDMIKKDHPELYEALVPVSMELCPAVAARQKATLQKEHPRVCIVVASALAMPFGDNGISGLISSKEMIDELAPVVLQVRGGKLYEVYMDVQDNNFVEVLREKITNNDVYNYFEQAGKSPRLDRPAEINVPVDVLPWQSELSRVSRPGTEIVTYDYDGTHPMQYAEVGFTLGFSSEADSSSPGTHDFTWDVDFKAISAIGQKNGLSTERLEVLSSIPSRATFKVLAQKKPLSAGTNLGETLLEGYFNSGRQNLTYRSGWKPIVTELNDAFSPAEMVVISRSLILNMLEMVRDAYGIKWDDLIVETRALSTGSAEESLAKIPGIMARMNSHFKTISIDFYNRDAVLELVSRNGFIDTDLGQVNWKEYRRKVEEDIKGKVNSKARIFVGPEYLKVTLFDKKDAVEKVLLSLPSGVVVAIGDSEMDVSFLGLKAPEMIDFRSYYVGNPADVKNMPAIRSTGHRHMEGTYEVLKEIVENAENGKEKLVAVIVDIDGVLAQVQSSIDPRLAVLLGRAVLLGARVILISGGLWAHGYEPRIVVPIIEQVKQQEKILPCAIKYSEGKAQAEIKPLSKEQRKDQTRGHNGSLTAQQVSKIGEFFDNPANSKPVQVPELEIFWTNHGQSMLEQLRAFLGGKAPPVEWPLTIDRIEVISKEQRARLGIPESNILAPLSLIFKINEY